MRNVVQFQRVNQWWSQWWVSWRLAEFNKSTAKTFNRSTRLYWALLFMCSGPYLCLRHAFFERETCSLDVGTIDLQTLWVSSSKAGNQRGTMQICHVSTVHSVELHLQRLLQTQPRLYSLFIFCSSSWVAHTKLASLQVLRTILCYIDLDFLLLFQHWMDNDSTAVSMFRPCVSANQNANANQHW